jgi:hypothetical protein
MATDQRVARLARLQPFVGEWSIEAPAFPLAPELELDFELAYRRLG